MSIQVNIGCGTSPTRNWRNYDNSSSVRLAKSPLRAFIVDKLGLMTEKQKEQIEFFKTAGVIWANGAKRIPEQDHTVSALYCCHMFEHLDKQDALRFLGEIRRVLQSGGVVRLAVPDISIHVQRYLETGDADDFISRTQLAREKPRTLLRKLKYLFIGDRNHQWMYDGKSLCKLLTEAGFEQATVMEPGTTMIDDHGELDLEERVRWSVYIEAKNP